MRCVRRHHERCSWLGMHLDPRGWRDMYSTCNSGYTLSGSRSCSSGTLTDTAVCNPDPSPSSPYDFTDCCGTKLKHWFDFSDTSVYGSSEVTKISGFTDKMGNAAGNTVNGDVQYKVNVQNGLNAIYANEQYASLQFSSNSGSNPEVFVAYRIVNNDGGRPLPHGFIFGGRAGYAFGSQWNSNNAEIGSRSPSYDTVTITMRQGWSWLASNLSSMIGTWQTYFTAQPTGS